MSRVEECEVDVRLGRQCLSCRHGEVICDGHVNIWCKQGHPRPTPIGQCMDYQDAGTADLLQAMVDKISATYVEYREAFDALDCPCEGCDENCCTPPDLDLTPFFEEDILFFLLKGMGLPVIPEKPGRCIFFKGDGCSFPSDVRPHACVEYRCTKVPSDRQLYRLSCRIDRAYVDLLAVCTRDADTWRGGKRKNGKYIDDFGRLYDQKDPFADLRRRYRRLPVGSDWEPELPGQIFCMKLPNGIIYK